MCKVTGKSIVMFLKPLHTSRCQQESVKFIMGMHAELLDFLKYHKVSIITSGFIFALKASFESHSMGLIW